MKTRRYSSLEMAKPVFRRADYTPTRGHDIPVKNGGFVVREVHSADNLGSAVLAALTSAGADLIAEEPGRVDVASNQVRSSN